jgi:hypothetical protein
MEKVQDIAYSDTTGEDMTLAKYNKLVEILNEQECRLIEKELCKLEDRNASWIY